MCIIANNKHCHSCGKTTTHSQDAPRLIPVLIIESLFCPCEFMIFTWIAWAMYCELEFAYCRKCETARNRLTPFKQFILPRLESVFLNAARGLFRLLHSTADHLSSVER